MSIRNLILSGLMSTALGCSKQNPTDASDVSVHAQSFESVVTGMPIPDDIRQSLLLEREGWGSQTSGGETAFVVTSLNDNGPGTLREALSSPGRWITFGVNGTLSLESPLWIPPNTTIDARLKTITIETTSAGTFTAAFFIHGANNVILTNLNLDNARVYGSNWNTDAEGHDAVEVRNSTDLWFHRNTFAHWADGAIDVRYSDNSQTGLQLPWGGTGLPRTLPTRISITRNKFHNIFQALSLTGDRISFGHNHCSNIKRRCIKAIFGRAYSYNNLIESWEDRSIQDAKDLPSGINPPGKDQYGNFVGNPADRFGKPQAELLSEQNIFSTQNKGNDLVKINKSSNGKISCKNNHGQVEFVDIDESINHEVFDELRSGPFVVRKTECRPNDSSCVSKKIKEHAKSAGASFSHDTPASSQTESNRHEDLVMAENRPLESQPPSIGQSSNGHCPSISRSPVSDNLERCGSACKAQLRTAAAAIGFTGLPGTGLDKYSVAKDIYKQLRSFGESKGCDPLRATKF